MNNFSEDDDDYSEDFHGTSSSARGKGSALMDVKVSLERSVPRVLRSRSDSKSSRQSTANSEAQLCEINDPDFVVPLTNHQQADMSRSNSPKEREEKKKSDGKAEQLKREGQSRLGAKSLGLFIYLFVLVV